MGQISFQLDPLPHVLFHMRKILGFGLDPLPPFGTISLNPYFYGVLKSFFCFLIFKQLIYYFSHHGNLIGEQVWLIDSSIFRVVDRFLFKDFVMII